MDANMFHLSLEQQFQLQCLEHELQQSNRDQIVDHLLEAMQQLMAKDNLIRDLMKKSKL
jgi:hypothetical protein